MEFVRQLLFLKARAWRKKDATINLPISIASYVFQTWVDAKSMKKELQQYVFYKEAAVRNYDPRGVIVRIEKKASQRPTTVKERSKEVPPRIKTPPASNAPPQIKESLLPIGKRQGTLGKYASMGSSKHIVVANTAKIS